MKKIITLLLVALLSIAASACSSSTTVDEKPVNPTPTPSETSSGEQGGAKEEIKDIIPFVKDGEIYFDLHVTEAIKDFAIQVDGKAIDSTTKSAPFTAESNVTVTGEGDPEKSVYVYIVFAQKEENQYHFEQNISNGLDADAAVERLGSIISRVLADNSKIYIAITDNPGDWDHSLSDLLNNFLDPFVSK